MRNFELAHSLKGNFIFGNNYCVKTFGIWTYQGNLYAYADNIFKVILIFFSFGVVSLLHYYDFFLFEDWVLIKFYLYSYILICGIGIKYSFSGFAPAFDKLIKEGSNLNTEKDINASIKKVKPWVIALWFGLILLSITGISKPDF